MQALTIIGLGTAWTNIRLMLFAVWPFGQSIREQVRDCCGDREVQACDLQEPRQQLERPKFRNTA